VNNHYNSVYIAENTCLKWVMLLHSGYKPRSIHHMLTTWTLFESYEKLPARIIGGC